MGEVGRCYEKNLDPLMREEAQWIAAKSEVIVANPERALLIINEMRVLAEKAFYHDQDSSGLEIFMQC